MKWDMQALEFNYMLTISFFWDFALLLLFKKIESH